MQTTRSQVGPTFAVLCMNVLLGIPAIIPTWLLWYFASNWPLAGLGLTQREPTENDGMLPVLVFLTPILAVSITAWWLANFALARRFRFSGKAYWTLCAATTLLPTTLLVLAA